MFLGKCRWVISGLSGRMNSFLAFLCSWNTVNNTNTQLPNNTTVCYITTKLAKIGINVWKFKFFKTTLFRSLNYILTTFLKNFTSKTQRNTRSPLHLLWTDSQNTYESAQIKHFSRLLLGNAPPLKKLF